MPISDDEIIEYLLGDASDKAKDLIESRLADDPDLVERLMQFRHALGLLDSVHGVFEPPSDIVESTMNRIDSLEAGTDTSQTPTPESSVTKEMSPAFWRGKNRVQFGDSIALTLSLSVLICLALPALVRARFESRKAQCADNLRTTGVGLIQYAMQDSQGRFPAVELRGTNGFAGIYAVRLRSSGLQVLPAQLQCPSLIGTKFGEATPLLGSIPTYDDLRQLDMHELVFVQNAVGGDYAYNLGVIENQSVVAPRYEGRTHFAILADSPVIYNDDEQFVAHDGQGVNTLYEDGRVIFIGTPRLIISGSPIDHPFRNIQGVHAVGLTPQDASLGPSYFAPLGIR